MEMTVIKEDVFTDSFFEIRGMSCHAGPCGEAPGSVRRQKEYREAWANLYCGFHGRE